MNSIFELTGSVLLKDNVSGALDDIDKKAKKTGSKLGKTFASIGKGAALVGTGMAAAGAAGLGMANKFADTADDIDKSAQRMGIGTTALQEMEFAMGQVGVSSSTYAKAMKRTNQRVGEAARGNKKYQEALLDMGYTMEEITSGQIDNDEVMMKTIKTLSSMEDSQAAAAKASDLFGKKTAQDLIPAINAGSDAIVGLREESHKLGKVQSEESIQAGVLFADTLDKVKTMASGLFMEFASNLLPVFQQLLEWVLANLPAIKETFGTIFNTIGTIIGTLISNIGTLIEWGKQWYEENKSTLDSVFETFKTIFEQIQTIITTFIDAIMLFWDEWGDEISALTTIIFDTIGGLISGALDVITGILDFFIGLFTGDWEKMGEGLEKIWSGLWRAIEAIVSGAFDIIDGIFGGAFSKIGDAIKSFKDSFSEKFTAMFDGVTKGANAFKEGFIKIFNAIKDGVKAPINMILGFSNSVLSGFEKMLGGVRSVINKIPEFHIPDWVPKIGGKSFSVPNVGRISIPRIPSLDVGTNEVLSDGLAMIHKGERIVPATTAGPYRETKNYNGGDIIIQKMEVRNDNDIKKVARELNRLKKSKAKARGEK